MVPRQCPDCPSEYTLLGVPVSADPSQQVQEGPSTVVSHVHDAGLVHPVTPIFHVREGREV